MTPRRDHRPLVAFLLLLLGIMIGLVPYSETLYRLFCSATGYAGTTQRVTSDTAKPSARMVTVRFSTNVANDLPWRFVPAQSEVQIHLGQDTLVFFKAKNLSARDYVGHATFNVTPDKAGIYFKKIQCFCFTEERLAAHQEVEMPVDFFVDPRLGTDPATRDVDTITLSYTFFVSPRAAGARDLARFFRDSARSRRRTQALCHVVQRLPPARPRRRRAAACGDHRAARRRRRRLPLLDLAFDIGRRLVEGDARPMA